MEQTRRKNGSNTVQNLACMALFGKQQATGKALLGMAALLMIPLMFITLLPGIIFGGFTEAYSPVDPDQPILNSETALVETASKISEDIRGVLRQALVATLAEIEQDFLASGADNYEIDNPYETDLSFSANQFVSMYCAAKGNDIDEISIDDMISILRNNLEHLYSYTCEATTREVTVMETVPVESEDSEDSKPNPDTSDNSTETEPAPTREVVVIEHWLIYSITYNGEHYFADHLKNRKRDHLYQRPPLCQNH